MGSTTQDEAWDVLGSNQTGVGATLTELYTAGHDQGTHPTSTVLSDAWYFAKRVTLSLALRSLGDAGRGFGRVGAAAALVAG